MHATVYIPDGGGVVAAGVVDGVGVGVGIVDAGVVSVGNVGGGGIGNVGVSVGVGIVGGGVVSVGIVGGGVVAVRREKERGRKSNDAGWFMSSSSHRKAEV